MDWINHCLPNMSGNNSSGGHLAAVSTSSASLPRNDDDAPSRPIAAVAAGQGVEAAKEVTSTIPVVVAAAAACCNIDCNSSDVQELAWKCHRCSRHNHLHQLRCPVCRAFKGRSETSTRASTEGCEIVWGVERHGDSCEVCGDGGELICCDNDGCDRVYHGNCIQVDDVGTLPNPWHCPACDPDSLGDMKMPSKKPVKCEEQYEDIHPDECYICYDGGLLVCCDYCDKSFHKHCHLPPLHSIPEGMWKCCECSAWSITKLSKCGECEACLREDCGKCIHCLDKPKFGGVNYLKQVCIHKKCPNKRYARPATVSPEAKLVVTRIKVEDEDNAEQSALAEQSPPAKRGRGRPRKSGSKTKQDENEDKTKSTTIHVAPKHASVSEKRRVATLVSWEKRRKNQIATAVNHVTPPKGKKRAAEQNQSSAVDGRRSKRAYKPSLKAKEVAESNVATSAANEPPVARTVPASTLEVSAAAAGRTGASRNTANSTNNAIDSKPAASVEVPAGGGLDAYSQVTAPFAWPNIGDADDMDNDDYTPNDLVICKMELKRARTEIKLKDNEIKRLKSAVQALTASLTG